MFISLERILNWEGKNNLFCHIYTLLVVIIGWVIFRAENLTMAVDYVKSLFGFGYVQGKYSQETFLSLVREHSILLIACFIFCIPLKEFQLFKKIHLSLKNSTCNILYSLMMILAFLTAVSYMVKNVYSPFIYFNF